MLILKYKKILCFMMFLMLLLSSSNVIAQALQGDDNEQQILILVGPQYGLPISDKITSSIVDTLTSAGISLDDIFVEFLDIHRISNVMHRSNLLITLENKLKDKNIKLIIAVNKGAVDFVSQEGHNLFPDAPMIIPINDSEPDFASESRKLIRLQSPIDAVGTLHNALQLFPKTKRIIIIMGKDDSHSLFIDIFTKAFDDLTDDLEIENTSNLTYEEMLKYVSSLPDDTIAIYGSYFEDKTGRTFVPAEVASQIAKTANIPVFTFRDVYINQGLVGGSVISTTEQGKQSANAGLDYLSGKILLDQQETYIEVDNVSLYNWRLLKQFGADPKVLPKDTVFLNYEPTLWESIRELIVATGSFILILLSLVILLLIINKQKKATLKRLYKSETELQENRDYLNNLIQNANAPIITWSPDYKITEFNRAFEKLTERSRDEVIGKHIKTLFPDDRRLESMKRIYSATKGTNFESEELPVLNASGKLYSVIWSSANIKNAKGENIATVAQGQDITQRKKAEEDLLSAYDSTISGWAHALDMRDHETEGHSMRVVELTLYIAKKMDINDEELDHIRRGAFLHDIGKMGIPDIVLLKPGKLTDKEWQIMKKHPAYAYKMLSSIEFLRPALDIPYCHHEKWDGSGYPCGLKGEEIPLPVRIFAVVDVYDALTSNRPYREAWTKEKALEHIKEQSGKHFDPQVVEAFVNLMSGNKT